MPDVNFGEIPFTYDEINIAAGLHKPGTQKSYNNETVMITVPGQD